MYQLPAPHRKRQASPSSHSSSTYQSSSTQKNPSFTDSHRSSSLRTPKASVSSVLADFDALSRTKPTTSHSRNIPGQSSQGSKTNLTENTPSNDEKYSLASLNLTEHLDSSLFPTTSIRLPIPKPRPAPVESSGAHSTSATLPPGSLTNPLDSYLFASPNTSILQEQIAFVWVCLNTGKVDRAEQLYHRLEKVFPKDIAAATNEAMINTFMEALADPSYKPSVVKSRWSNRQHPASANTPVVSVTDRILKWFGLLKGRLRKDPSIASSAIVLHHALTKMDLDLARTLIKEMEERASSDLSWVEVLRSDPRFNDPEDLATLDAFLKTEGNLGSNIEQQYANPSTSLSDLLNQVESKHQDTSVRSNLLLSAMTDQTQSYPESMSPHTPNQTKETNEPVQDSVSNPLKAVQLKSTNSVGVLILRRTLESIEKDEMQNRKNHATNSISKLEMQQRLEQKALVAALEEKEVAREKLPSSLRDLMYIPSRYMVEWNKLLVPLIKRELEIAAEREVLGNADENSDYLSFLKLLTPEQLSRITLTEVLRLPDRRKSDDEEDISRVAMYGISTVVAVTSNIGKSIEREYNTQQVFKYKNNRMLAVQKGIHNMHMSGKLLNITMRKIMSQLTQAENKLDEAQTWRPNWPDTIRVKAGTLLLSLLLQVARVLVPSPDLNDPSKDILRSELALQHIYVSQKGKRIGAIRFHPLLVEQLSSEPIHTHPRLLPMVVKPRPWVTRNSGGYLIHKSEVVRVNNNPEHLAYLAAADERNHLVHVYEALDVLGSTAWRINEKVFDVVKTLWNDGAPIAGLPAAEMPRPDPKPANWSELTTQERREFAIARNKVETDRRNAFSQRCDANYKIEIARAFLGETLFFPHNLDFRGRAYPLPSHLSHISNDLCRGLLTFDKAKPLGVEGLRWLKIQVSNLAGFDKASFDEREKFCDDNIEKIRDSAENPLSGQRWWLKAEDPWQLLATCFEVNDALKSPDPTKYESRIPVHQDGTCNGLQHYAALGGDEKGATEVNLVASDKPSDIYSTVANSVRDRINKAADEGCEISKKLVGKINRKLVKQTVMTSTYGVTFVGARRQVMSRMKENRELYPFTDAERKEASLHVTRLIFDGLSQLFTGARLLQSWLNTTARMIAKSSNSEVISKSQLDDAKKLHEMGCLPSPFTVASAEAKQDSEQNNIELADDADLDEVLDEETDPLLDAALDDSQSEDVKDLERAALDKINEEAQETVAAASIAASKAEDPKSPVKMTSVIWTTPLGLPIVQPYRSHQVKDIKTMLQTVRIVDFNSPAPVNPMKQSTAFPPNFVHSLDATHMMLSALDCHRAGIDFASVHDSYWTHAANVSQMSKILREAFIKLHSMNVMKRLRDEFVARYCDHKYPVTITLSGQDLQIWKKWLEETGRHTAARTITPKTTSRKITTWVDLAIPPLPPKGDFDITNVRDSPYFFN